MHIYCKLKNGKMGVVVDDNNGDETYGVIMLSDLNDSMDYDMCDSRTVDIPYSDIAISSSDLAKVQQFND